MRSGPTLAALALASLLAFAPTAAAHGDSWKTYIVTAHEGELNNETVAWFTVDANPGANPNIHIDPGDTLLLHFVNLNQNEHNHTLQLGAPLHNTTGPIPPGNETSLQLDIPSNLTHSIPYEDPTWTTNPVKGQLALNQSQPNNAPTPSPLGLVILAALTGLAAPRARPA